MKLRDQILALGLAGAFIAALVGAVGLFSAGRLEEAFDGAVSMGLAVQNSQRAAMMHGAVRGDVQRAMLGAIGRDKAQIADAQAALDQHVKSLDAALHTLKGLPLSPQTKTLVDTTLPMVRTYTDAAGNLLKLTAGDTPAAAAASIPGFQKLYNNVEAQMAEQVDAIGRDERAFSARSRAVVAQARIGVIAALAIATLILVAGALGLSRHLAGPMSQAVQVARTLAQGDLSVRVRPAGNDKTVQLLQAMTDMQRSLGGIVGMVKSNADRVANASSEIAQGNRDLSARTERQASSLQQSAASMEQLGATVRCNAASAAQADQLAVKAAAMAARGGDVVGQVVQTMQAIQEHSKRISDIVALVDGIAAQTNILALNAAVEAARAGEAGRGFAVVATEVRSLAQRAAQAAKDIAGLVGASAERVERGASLVDEARVAMADVVSGIQHVTQIMAEISAASSEQSVGVAQVERAVTDMDEATQRNASLVEQMATAAANLKQQAYELVQAVAVFRVGEHVD